MIITAYPYFKFFEFLGTLGHKDSMSPERFFIEDVATTTIWSALLGPNTRLLEVFSAALFFIIPAFLSSWYIEFKVLKWKNKDFDPKEINKTVFISNSYSYFFIELISFVIGVYVYLKHGLKY